MSKAWRRSFFIHTHACARYSNKIITNKKGKRQERYSKKRKLTILGLLYFESSIVSFYSVLTVNPTKQSYRHLLLQFFQLQTPKDSHPHLIQYINSNRVDWPIWWLVPLFGNSKKKRREGASNTRTTRRQWAIAGQDGSQFNQQQSLLVNLVATRLAV